MPHDLDRYTPRLRQSLVLAAQEAIRLGRPGAGPEELLLGMLREGTGLASQVLTSLGVNLGALRTSIETGLEPVATPRGKRQQFTDAATSVLDAAESEARTLKSNYVGQEHVLLALLRETGLVTDVLGESYVTYDLARQQVVAILSGHTAKTKLKRYNLALPEDMFDEVEQLADQEHTTVLEVLRRSIRLGLLVARAQKNPDAALILREGATERRLVLL